MKYNIHLNQQVLSNTTLDVVDASILDFLIFFHNSKSPKIERQRKEGWSWIDYNELLRQMPLLRIKSKGALTPRINKIKRENYIETKRIGRKLYFRLTEKIDELFINMNDTVHENEQSKASIVHENEPIKINNNKYNKDKDTSNKVALNPLIELFSEVNPTYEKLFKNKTERKSLEDLVKKFGEGKIKQIIEVLPMTNKQQYAPTITTPYQLEKNLGKLKSFFDKQRSSTKGKKIIISNAL